MRIDGRPASDLGYWQESRFPWFSECLFVNTLNIQWINNDAIPCFTQLISSFKIHKLLGRIPVRSFWHLYTNMLFWSRIVFLKCHTHAWALLIIIYYKKLTPVPAVHTCWCHVCMCPPYVTPMAMATSVQEFFIWLLLVKLLLFSSSTKQGENCWWIFQRTSVITPRQTNASLFCLV